MPDDEPEEEEINENEDDTHDKKENANNGDVKEHGTLESSFDG